MELPDPRPDIAPPPAEDAKPDAPRPSRSADVSLIIFVALLALAGLFVAGRGVWNLITPSRPAAAFRQTDSRTEPQARVVTRLDYGSGHGDKVGDEFDVSYGCRKIVLTFSGEQLDDDIDVAWVAFRVYDAEIADYSIDHSGPHDLLDSSEGSSRLTLPAGSTYYVETSAFNAGWYYRINCE